MQGIWEGILTRKNGSSDVPEVRVTLLERVIEGVEITMREMLSVFSKHGIVVISPEVGDRFDPQQHEAMFEPPLPGTKAGDIIQVSA